jgi:hypothetical protein
MFSLLVFVSVFTIFVAHFPPFTEAKYSYCFGQCPDGTYAPELHNQYRDPHFRLNFTSSAGTFYDFGPVGLDLGYIMGCKTLRYDAIKCAVEYDRNHDDGIDIVELDLARKDLKWYERVLAWIISSTSDVIMNKCDKDDDGLISLKDFITSGQWVLDHQLPFPERRNELHYLFVCDANKDGVLTLMQDYWNEGKGPICAANDFPIQAANDAQITDHSCLARCSVLDFINNDICTRKLQQHK